MPSTCSAGETFFKTDAAAGRNLYACTATNTWTVIGGLPDGTGSDGKVLAGSGNLASWQTITGDVAGRFDALTIEKIRGRRLSSGTPIDGDTLQWNTATAQWEPSAGVRGLVPGAGISISGSTIAVENAVIPFYSTGTSSPSAIPCVAGRDLYLNTASSEYYFCRANNVWEKFAGTTHQHAGVDITTGQIDNARTSASVTNTANTIVQRNASGDFSARIVTADLTGNAATATALKNAPTGCAAGQYATGIDARGNLTCASVSGGAGSGTNLNTANAVVQRDANGDFSARTITADLTGNAVTATALKTAPTGCTAGQYATGIDARGNLTCAAAATASGTAVNTANTLVQRNGSGDFAARIVTADLTGNASTATAFKNPPTGCAAGQYATGINASGNLTCAAVPVSGVSAATPGTMVQRDANGDFSARIVTADLIGNASTATALKNPPTGCAAGQYATGINASGNLTCAAVPVSGVSAATPGTMVQRDANGDFSARTVTADLTGNAVTATALKTTPTGCAAGQYATGIDARGNLTCAAASASGTSANTANTVVQRNASGDFSARIVTADLTGNASTATALKNTPTGCAAGQYATGIDASGNLTCAAATASGTSANTANTVVQRNASGDFSARIVTADLTGNASTATALKNTPTGCAANQYATGIDASGNLTCAAASASGTSANTANTVVQRNASGDFSARIVTADLTGNASTATALKNTPTGCAANQYATGIDTAGNLTCATLYSPSKPLPASPRSGEVVVDSGDSAMKWYDGTNWRVASSVPDGAFFDRTVVSLREEFLGAGTTSGQIGALGWITAAIGGGSPSASYRTSEPNRPGLLRLSQSGSPTSGQGMALYLQGSGLSGFYGLTGVSNWEMQAAIRLSSTDANLYFGFADATAISTTNAANLGNALMFRFDTGLSTPDSATFRFVRCAASVCNTVDTGVTVDTNFNTFRIRSVTPGTVLVSINGQTEISISTGLPATTAVMSPAIFSLTRTASARIVDIDWFGFEMRGVAR